MNSKKRSQFKSGIYRPQNIEKFGESKCIYRSSYELKFLKWCDYTDKIKKIYYEKIVIPYICKTDGKLHKYYVDCGVDILESTGLKRYLVEIKPYRQTIPPKPSKRKKQTTVLEENLNWLKNQSKWGAAKQYCENKQYRWFILTEKGFWINNKFYEKEMF